MDSTRSTASQISANSDRFSAATLVVLAALIASVVLLLFGRSIHFDFINYDDPAYVYDNPIVSQGLTQQGVKWAVTEVGKTNLWHPLTWLSHMVDVELFGLKSAGGHHGVNVFWHLVGALGLFFLIRKITGGTWVAFFVASIWAFHPQRVQSVIWISERKDVLSGAFFLWSWWSWEKWRAESEGRKRWYLMALGLFVLAGLSKPSVVPLPFIFWCREMLRGDEKLSLRRGTYWLVRVLPFVIVAVVVAGLTVYFQRIGGMANVTDVMPLSKRLVLMPHSLWWYVQNFFYPVPGKLWVYPPSAHMSALLVPTVALFCVFLVVVIIGRKLRVVWFGACVFILLWLPVSGLIPVSFYYVADRYSYLIHLGIIMVVAGILKSLTSSEDQPSFPILPSLFGSAAVLLVVVFSWARVSHWKDSESLFSHECSINERSLLAPIHLGVALEEKGRYQDALELFRQAISRDSESGLAAYNAARMLELLDREDAALAMYQTATEKKILHHSAVYRRYAMLLTEKKKIGLASAVLARGLERFPNDLNLMLDLGEVATNFQQDPMAGIQWYDRVLRKHPKHPDALQGKAVALIALGKVDEGRAMLEYLLKLYPNRLHVRRYLRKLDQPNSQ